MEVGFPERFGMALGTGAAIAGLSALVVLALLLFTWVKLPPANPRWLGFFAAMSVPAMCIAPLSLINSYDVQEERAENLWRLEVNRRLHLEE